MLQFYPLLAGATLLTLIFGILASDKDRLFTALEGHLRSQELSQKRNIFYQDNLQAAREYILDFYRGLCQLEQSPTCDDIEIVNHFLFHEFEYGFEDYVPYGIEDPDQVFPMDYEGENLILLVKGKRWGTSEDRPLVIGAHYDTFGNSSGVNDNGAGVAAMLEMSRLVVTSNVPRDNTLIFVAFDLEEYGTIGSDHFLHAWLLPELLHKYCIPVGNFQGAIILDTIMNYNTTENSQNMDFSTKVFDSTNEYLRGNQYRGDFISVVGRERDDADLMDAIASTWASSENVRDSLQTWKLPFTGRPSADLHDDYHTLMRSDHATFWMFNNMDGSPDSLKAVFVTDTAPYRGDMQLCYHNACDDINSITDDKIRFLASITRTVTDVVLKLANTSAKDGDRTPEACPVSMNLSGSAVKPSSSALFSLVLFGIASLLAAECSSTIC